VGTTGQEGSALKRKVPIVTSLQGGSALKCKAPVAASSESDDDYTPPKQRQPELESPQHVYDDSGNELTEETDVGQQLVTNFVVHIIHKLMKNQEEKCSAAKKKQLAKSSSNTGTRTWETVADGASESCPDSGEESDGLSAMQSVEEKETGKGARRGPSNASMQYFKGPIPVQDRNGNKRWEFQCRYCAM
jgi:hypothetical protein